MSLGTTDESAAHEALLTWWLANRNLVHENPRSVSLPEVLWHYYKANESRLHSADFVRLAHAKVCKFSGMLTVAEFQRDAQREFLRALQSHGASDGYSRRLLGVVKAAFNWAVDERLVSDAPVVKLPPDGAPRDRVLSFEESQAIWFATELEHERYFLILAYATLSRPEATLDLKREMVDFDRRLFDTNPKARVQTKKHRPVVPVVDELLPWLENAPNGYLVRWRDQPIQSFKTAWRAIRRRAHLGPDVYAKTIRHTMATELRAAGVPEAEVQGFLGHRAYAGSTEIYAKYRPDYLGKAAGVVNGYLLRLRSSCVAPDAY